MSSSATPPINTLIWLSVKPMIKLVIPAGAGFFLTRAQMFSLAGSRSAAQIILNITLPALLFSKIIPSFNPNNIGAIGPIVLVALVYMGLNLFFGFVVKMLFPCPRNFRWGILSAAAWGNWGDLPTSVVQTGTEDSNLAIGFVAIFILVFYVTLFPLRGMALIQWDYTRPPKDDDDVPSIKWWKMEEIKRRAEGFSSVLRRRKGRPVSGELEAGHGVATESIVAEREPEQVLEEKDASTKPNFPSLQRVTTSRLSRHSDLRRMATIRSIGSVSVREMAGAVVAPSFEDTDLHGRRLSESRGAAGREQEKARLRTIVGGSSVRSEVFDDEVTEVGTSEGHLRGKMAATSAGASRLDLPVTREDKKDGSDGESLDEDPSPNWTTARILRGLKNFIFSLLTPPTISLVTAIVCAVVNDLKCLFVVVEGSSFHPTAPDGDPPLAILLDTASFLGNASVPLGLLVLGSALARMKVPRPFSRLPLGSIISLAVAKLIFMPIFGFFFVEALVHHTNLVSADDRVLRFVLIYFSAVPTATTQVALTQIYAPEDGESNSDILAAYLIAQYSIFAISSVFLTSFTLKSLF